MSKVMPLFSARRINAVDDYARFFHTRSYIQQRSAAFPGPHSNRALAAWIEARGSVPGPLFTNYDRAGKGQRLSGTSINRLTHGLGLGRPHGIRHAAITEALDLMGGDVRKVARFSRHRDMRVVATYDDNRQDLAGEVARIVASNL